MRHALHVADIASLRQPCDAIFILQMWNKILKMSAIIIV